MPYSRRLNHPAIKKIQIKRHIFHFFVYTYPEDFPNVIFKATAKTGCGVVFYNHLVIILVFFILESLILQVWQKFNYKTKIAIRTYLTATYCVFYC